MKSGWKIFWIVCGILALAGAALCVAGAVSGATLNSVRSLFKAHENYEIWEDEDSVHQDEAYDHGDGEEISQDSLTAWTEYPNIRELDIDVSSLPVEIRSYAGESIMVCTDQVHPDLEKYISVKSDGGTLEIEFKNTKIWDQFHNDKGALVIDIPEDFKLEEASLSVGAGELYIESINAEELNIEVGAGEVHVEQFTAGELELECGTGEADIRGTCRKEAGIECGFGSVSYSMPGKMEEYDYELNCGIGELRLGDKTYSGLGKTQIIDNHSGKKIRIDCGIGEVVVTFGNVL